MIPLEILALAPLLVLSVATIVLLLLTACCRSHRLIALLTIAGFTLALAAIGIALGVAPRQVTTLLSIDGFALFIIGIIIFAGQRQHEQGQRSS